MMPLDLPEPDPQRLASAPLDLVVCQVRYETNLGVSDSKLARAFHEAVGGRHGIYSNIGQVVGQAINVSVEDEGARATTSSAPLSGWRFGAVDDSWIISLMPDHVALETSAYTTWDEFRVRLGDVLTAAADAIDPAFEHRLGLRYIDRLDDLEIETPKDWGRYVSAHLLGPVLDEALGPAITATRQALFLRLTDEMRCNFNHGFFAEPGDTRLGYLLDYDLFRQDSRPFDARSIMSAAEEMHRSALQLFQASIVKDYWETLATS
jgi:uncharacterized protein (TIGR04255 family)